MQPYPFLGHRDDRPGAPALAGASSALSVSGFVVCPVPVPAMMGQVYQIAYAQAQAVVAPSRLELLEKATLN